MRTGTIAAMARVGVVGLADAGRADDLIATANESSKPIPSVVPAVKGNAVTHDRVELGRMLFFEPRLSRSGLFSCNSCHNLGVGGVDGLETSIGHGWQKGPRFLQTLTGEQPRVEDPILPPSTASTPRPEMTLPLPAN